MIYPIAVQMIMRRLYTNGYEAYVVGGAVRDSLLNKEPHAYELITDATSEEVKALFTDFKVIDTGIEQGNITVIIVGQSVKITTYSGSKIFNPLALEASISSDLYRRDFTINALACGDDNTIIDLFGGEEDLKKNR